MAAPRTALWLAVVWCVLIASGCEQGPECAAVPPEGSVLEILYDGCALRGEVCVLEPESELRLWYAAAFDWRVDVTLPADWSRVRENEVLGGQRVVMTAGGEGGKLEVVAVKAQGCASWSLEVAVEEPPAWLVDVRRSGNNPAAVRRLLEADLAEHSGDPGPRLDSLARSLRKLEEPWQPTLHRAIQEHRRAGRIDLEVRARAFLHHMLIQAADFERAGEVLDGLPSDAEIADGPARGRFLADYQRAVNAEKQADPATAAGRAERAMRVAERIGNQANEITAAQLLARQRRRLGAHAQAEMMFARLEERAEEPALGFDRSKLLNNIAWDRLMALDYGLPADDPSGLFRRSLELLSDRESDLQQVFGRNLNLALAALQQGRAREAASFLARAASLDVEPRPRDALWSVIADARLALALGDAEVAVEHAERLVSLDPALLTADVLLAAAAVEAAAHVRLGARAHAITVLELAQRRLDDAAASLLPDPASENTVAQDVPFTRVWLELLLAEGKVDAAFGAVERALARPSRGFAGNRCADHLSPERREQRLDEAARLRGERDRLWNDGFLRLALQPTAKKQLAREGLRERSRQLEQQLASFRRGLEAECRTASPGPPLERDLEELVIAIYPLADAWLAFAVLGDGVGYERIDGGLSLPAVARRALEAFYEPIRRATRVRILAWGALADVDFHALEVGGSILVEHLPVVYGFGLPRRTSKVAKRVGVVGDPRRDLPRAFEEARDVEGRLRVAGYQVDLLIGAEADQERVRSLLGSVGRFHFAGHGEVDDVRGESALLLAGRQRLSVGDLWLLEAVPDRVVLLACSTAGGAAPMDLARAFLERGSTSVVASTREVSDAAAAVFSRAFYQALAGGEDEAAAVRLAQLALRHAMPGGAWASYRILARR